MEDYLLMELLKTKSKADPEFDSKLTEYMRSGRVRRNYTHSQYPSLRRMENEHFDEYQAKRIVDAMYHLEDKDKMVSGEHFSMFKATSVCDAYKKMHHIDATPEDVYVAINAQYHDYSKLFKTWFGSNADTKIIESAMCFWFTDEDYSKGSKVWNYFEEL
jgi:hypothetical protein